MNFQDSSDSARWGREGPYPGYTGGVRATGALPSAGPQNGEANGEVDIRGVLLTLWRRKTVIVVSVVFCTLIGLLATSQMVPSYTASARLLINPERLNIVNMQQVLVSPDATNRDNIQNQVEIIRSTGLLEKVADKLQLEHEPEFNPSRSTAPPSFVDQATAYVSGLFESAFLADLGFLPAPPAAAVSQAEDTMSQQRMQIVQSLRSELSIRPLTNSRVVEISFNAPDPHLAARITNGIANEFISEQLDAQLEATRSASIWLRQQAEELQARVRDAENAVETMRAELTQAAGQGAAVTAQQLQVFVSALASVRAARSRIETRIEIVSQAIETGRDFGVISEFRSSPIMQEYRQRLTSLRDQEVSLRAVRSDDPELRILEARMDAVHLGMQLEAQLILEGLTTELGAAKDEERALLQQISELEQKALEQAREELRLRELEREAEGSRRLYESIFSRLNEISVQETLQTPGARLLSAAEPPTWPETASSQRVVTFAGMGGVFLGVGLIFLLERLNNTYRGGTEIEGQTGVPVLAALPKVGKRTRLSELLDNQRKHPTSLLAETVRNLRTSILFSDVDSPPKVVMFTSSLPGEGKSAASMLIARASQQAGKTTVIIDCDLRLRSLGAVFPADDGKPGLLSVLDGSASVGDAIVKDPVTGLHLLTTRQNDRLEVSPADVLTSTRFSDMIGTLRDRYELVILDTPPVLLVTDPRLVAAVADAVIYAVRCDHTPRNAVLAGLRELQRIRAPVVGVILTLVSARTSRNNAREGCGYYSRRYKGYYGL